MKLATFRISGSTTWGIIEGEEAVDIGAVVRDRLPDLKSAITAGALSRRVRKPPKPGGTRSRPSSGCPSFPTPTRFFASA